MPSPTSPIAILAPYTDLVFLAQVVGAVIESMSSMTVPVASASPTTLVTHVSLNNITVLVRTMKNMRTLGCEAFLGE